MPKLYKDLTLLYRCKELIFPPLGGTQDSRAPLMSQLVCMQLDLICRAGDGARLLDVIIVQNNEGRGSPAGARA